MCGEVETKGRTVAGVCISSVREGEKKQLGSTSVVTGCYIYLRTLTRVNKALLLCSQNNSREKGKVAGTVECKKAQLCVCAR